MDFPNGDHGEARNYGAGDRCISTADCSNSNNPILFPCGRAVFNLVEHPLELELELELESEQDDGINEASEEEEEEEESTDNEEECSFMSLGAVDSMVFAEEEDASNVHSHQTYDCMQSDYETLASKKRSLDRTICETPGKRFREEVFLGASFEEIMETMNYGVRRKSKKNKNKQKGRRKGSKNKANPEVTQKLGDATLHYAHGRFEEAICLLKEVICLAPNISYPYHTLGLIYNAMNDRKRAMDFYMIAAHLTPRDASLWKLLVTWSIEQGDIKQANYCLGKAITADPEDIDLRFHRASLFVELGEHQKAADLYEQISRIDPDNIEVLGKVAQMYKKCGQHERAVCTLEEYLRNHADHPDLSLVDMLASILLDINAYAKILDHIEQAQKVYFDGKEFPLCLLIKAGICHVHLGHMEKAEACFSILRPENASSHPQLIMDIADSLTTADQHVSALKYYMMLEESGNKQNGYIHLKIARCCVSLRKRVQAVEYYYKAIQTLDDSVDARLRLSSLLLEEGREDEAISVLSPPPESESSLDPNLDVSRSWWLSRKIKLKLSQIYKSKGSYEAFVDVIFPLVHQTLILETVQQKVKPKKRLSRSVLFERVKLLADHQTRGVFHGFRPVASSADIYKASRAKRLLKKKDAIKEVKRAATLAAGIDWKSDDSDDDHPQVFQESPLPDLLKDEEHNDLILDLCKSLSSLRRYWDALEIINLCLKVGNTLSIKMKEELRTLGARISYNLSDPVNGWDCVRYMVMQHPYSLSAWNCYYNAISRFDNRYSRHNKFLHTMRTKHKGSVPPLLIAAHHFTMISQHQAAAREYLEAYKLMPDNPLINLCVGTALINLALGHRLPNKHQSILQGLAFLHNNTRLCENNQESFYNIARAYHHIGLVSLATTYYEKVLSVQENDRPIPKLPNENQEHTSDVKRHGYCDLRREAAYNLHLIYKKSGALDLARQVLKDYVVT